MLKHTKKIEEIYEDIQRKLYYMVPEKWDELYLYASVIDKPNGTSTGELFFYYIPKGILRKKPVSGYEIPTKFNLDENEYLKLVDILYAKIKELRFEQKKLDIEGIWSNLTLTIKNSKFKIIYDYEDLAKSDFNSYERHILWRHYILGISLEQCTREEKGIIKRYETGAKVLARREEYESGIYIKNIRNIVDYTTQSYDNNTRDIEYIADEEKIVKNRKNQILMNEEVIKEEEQDGKYQIKIKEGKQKTNTGEYQGQKEKTKSKNKTYEIKIEKPQEKKPKKYTLK